MNLYTQIHVQQIYFIHTTFNYMVSIFVASIMLRTLQILFTEEMFEIGMKLYVRD